MWKKYLEAFLKFVISGLALYVVFRSIDPKMTLEVMLIADSSMLLLATLFFIGSKWVSAIRLNYFFYDIGLKLSNRYNLKLYWVGMFYNLFLPGGIGGDGYKIFLLRKKYETSLRQLTTSVLLDRINGLMALCFLTGLGVLMLPFNTLTHWVTYLLVPGILLVYPLYYLALRKLFRLYLSSIHRTSILSLGVQVLQLLSALCILWSIGVNDKYLEYLVLFLLSSVVAVFPFTIGGVGARELTFVLGYTYLGIDEHIAVAFSLLFFTITAFVSLAGGVISMRKKSV
ncbi:MAG: flippase-like domain-containing protein [Cyclobacteriaceae bacterium]|nr:flippase-like domain-containing protein [Cyclobacteriaceae bacterium HetDA_MAG_MS6]